MRKALRFAAALLVVAAILALYDRLLTVNNTTVALTLLLAILGISARVGLAEATVASVAAVLGFNYYFLPPNRNVHHSGPPELGRAGGFSGDRRDRQPAFRARPPANRGCRSAASRYRAALRAGAVHDPHRQTPRKTIREFVNRVVQVFGCNAAAFYYRPDRRVLPLRPGKPGW